MNHSELVDIACRWLRKTVGCGVVVTEMVTCAVTGEIPDALGWKGTTSFLVECKTSRADFHADKKKTFRMNPDSGVGCFRFFLTPKGLMEPSEIPDRWGLLEWDGKRVFKTHGCPKGNIWYPTPFKPATNCELSIMYSACRRLIDNCEYIRQKVSSRQTKPLKKASKRNE